MSRIGDRFDKLLDRAENTETVKDMVARGLIILSLIVIGSFVVLGIILAGQLVVFLLKMLPVWSLWAVPILALIGAFFYATSGE